MAFSQKTTIELKSLNLFQFSRKLAEEYKPVLTLYEKSLEFSWEVDGKPMKLTILRSEMMYDPHTEGDPSHFELVFKPGNQLNRHFVEPALLSSKNEDMTSIVAIARLDGFKYRNYNLTRGMEPFGAKYRMTPTRTRHISKLILTCDQLPSFIKDQLRKTAYISTSPLRPGPIPSSTTQQVPHDTQKVVEISCVKTVSSTAAVTKPSASLSHSTASYLNRTSALEDDLQILTEVSRRIQLKLATFAQQEEDAAKKEVIIKHQQEEIATLKRSLKQHQEETASQKVSLKHQQDKLVERERDLAQEAKVLNDATMELQKLAKKRKA